MTCISNVYYCLPKLFIAFGFIFVSVHYSLKLKPNFQEDYDKYVYDQNFYKVCKKESYVCLNDKLGFEAISLLHSHIDADKDGDLERSESQDFMQEDLQRDAHSVTHRGYHSNDNHVTVHDLWDYWIQSEVYNWTVDDVIVWLDVHVGLHQYSQQFKMHDINGRLLPRLASTIHCPLYALLGIRNIIHKQKISLKAADIVLFGVPKAAQHSMFPDVMFISSLALAILGFYVGYRKHKQTKRLMKKLNFDLVMLQHAEDSLKKFQMQLDESLKRRRVEEDERDELVRKLMKRKEVSNDDNDDVDKEGTNYDDGGGDDTLVNINSLHEELFQKKMELLEAEQLLEEKKKTCMPHLQQWLQLTYEMESRAFEEKKANVEKNLKEAKQVCEKIKKQRFKFFGSLKQNQTEDRTDLVKDKLNELKKEMEERCMRWKEIERLTSYNIITNPGVSYLNSLLRGSRMSLYMPANNQLSKSSTASSYLNTYPIMSNLLKVGMQLSAVGLNSNVIQPPVSQTHLSHLVSQMYRDNSRPSLPLTFSNASVKSLQFNNHPIDSLQSHMHLDFKDSNLKSELTHSQTHGNFIQHHSYVHKVNPMFYISDSSPSLSPDEAPSRNLFNDFIIGRNVKGDAKMMKNFIIKENPQEENGDEDQCDYDGLGGGSNKSINQLANSNTPKKKNRLAKILNKTLSNIKNK